MKKLLSLFTIFALTSMVFANGVSLNSPGTRAISMGGAYISIVNDYSAPYWNPAGLVNVCGPQASFFLTDIIPSATYKYDAANIDAKNETQHLLAPNAAFLWKCKFYNKLHLGLSFIVPAGLGVKWKGEDLAVLAGNDPDLNWESSIKVFNISLSGAMNFKEKLNVGAAFHLVRGSMTMDKGLANPAGGGLQYSEESDGWGFGFGLGAQYLLNKKITLGAAMRTAMSVNFKGEADNPLLPIIAPMYGTTAPAESDFEREITWPLWVGGGIAYRPMEKLLLALEAQWSRWGYYEDELVAEFDNSSWEQILTANGGNTIHLHWDNATQIRLGGEYLLNDKIALRGGFYIDPAPGPDETQTILIPNTDFTVITCGFGYKPMCNLNIDFGFEYLIGKERNVTEVEYNNLTTPPTPIGMLGKHGMSIVVPSIAVTYHFCSGKDKPCGSCKGTCK